MGLFRVFLLQSYKWMDWVGDGMGWDLCVGLLYEHRFAVLKIRHKTTKIPVLRKLTHIGSRGGMDNFFSKSVFVKHPTLDIFQVLDNNLPNCKPSPLSLFFVTFPTLQLSADRATPRTTVA